MIRKRELHAESATERARVAAELITEAELLTKTGGMATPAEVDRERLPAPLTPVITATETAPDGTERQKMEQRVPRAEAFRIGEPWERPLAALDAKLTTTPDDTGLLLERAQLLGSIGRLGAARVDLDRVIQNDPDSIEALLALAALMLKKGLRADAVPYLRRAVERAPERVGAWQQLGECLNQLDDLAGARSAFERAIALDAGHARALYGLGIVLDRMNRPDEATLLYRRSREAAGSPPGTAGTGGAGGRPSR